MRIMISQPRYLPTINYLRRILSSDLFIILDNVQGKAVDMKTETNYLQICVG